MAIGVHISDANTSLATSITTTGIVTTSGSTIIMFVYSDSTNFAASNPITDNKGNTTWAQLGGELNTGVGKYSRAYKHVNIAGGSGHTFTATFQANGYFGIYVCEVLDVSTNPTVSNAQQLDDVSSPWESTTVAPSGACVLIGSGAVNVSTGTDTHDWGAAGSSFVTGDKIENITDADNRLTGSMAAVVKGSGGTYKSAFTSSLSPTAAHVYVVSVETTAGSSGISTAWLSA
jgi:hypothetical protein